MAPEYGADLRLLPRRWRNHPLHGKFRSRQPIVWPSSRPIARRRACGVKKAWKIRSSPTRWSLIWARSFPPWPGRSAPRVVWRWATLLPASRPQLAKRIQEDQRCGEALPGQGHRPRSRPWRRGDRGDHVVHQHLQSERADRRRPCWRAMPNRLGLKQSPGSNLARPPAARWWPNISRRPACRRNSTSSASTWSASAARPASAIPALCRRRFPRPSTKRGLIAASVLSGQPQFRRPRIA